MCALKKSEAERLSTERERKILKLFSSDEPKKPKKI